jgi:DNA-binding transcriptional MerR regulator
VKIGEVSRELGISADSIRFYVREGLLIPDAKGLQHDFGSSALEDLRMLLRLKNLGFSLREIHRILSLRRVSDPTDPEDLSDLLDLYARKRRELEERRRRIEGAMAALDREVETFCTLRRPKAVRSGVPLRALELLRCPLCGLSPSLTGASMDARWVHEGTLVCPCGYGAEIREGILRTGHLNTSRHDRPDTTRELYKDLPSPLVTLFAKAHDWMFARMDRLCPPGGTILETHPNAYFFLYIVSGRIPRENLYVVIDKFPETLEMYKRKIDLLGRDLDILYLADASPDYPLREGCFDGFVDFFGSNEEGFYREEDLLRGLDRFLAPGAGVLGTYFHYPPRSRSVRNLCAEYPEATLRNFDLSRYRRALAETSFAVLEEERIGSVTDAGKNLAFGFHEPGEELGLLSFLAKRSPTGPDRR